MLLLNTPLYSDGKEHGATAFVSDRHYTLVAEGTAQLSARQFLVSSHRQPASTLLDYLDLVYGNVVEIDDGLRPCCSYHRSHRNLAVCPKLHQSQSELPGREGIP